MEKQKIAKGGFERYVDNPVLPRLTLSGENVREETIRHHLKRYELAANHVRPGSTAIDLCCGTGYGTGMLKTSGANRSIGVDLSHEGIRFAQREYGHTGAQYIEADVIKFLNEIEENPDVITFFEAIEHIPREVGLKVLDACKESLSETGVLLVSTPRDIRSDVNPDHITQWTFGDLKTALEERFDEVAMFGQDWSTGEFVYDSPHQASFIVGVCKLPIRSA